MKPARTAISVGAALAVLVFGPILSLPATADAVESPNSSSSAPAVGRLLEAGPHAGQAGGIGGKSSKARAATTSPERIRVGTDSDEFAAAVDAAAKRLEGVRYLFGGDNPRVGIDCSRFTQLVFIDAAGVDLGPNTDAQERRGDRVPVAERRPGMLVFYDYPGGHVGVIGLHGTVVHASSSAGKVVRVPWSDMAEHVKQVRTLTGMATIPAAV